MSSAEIKDTLEYQFRGSNAKDWKRTAKKIHKVGHRNYEIRTFHNSKIDQEVVVMNEDDADSSVIIEGGQMLYYAVEDEDEKIVRVIFCPETMWDRVHYIPDRHLSLLLRLHYGLDPNLLDEESENNFSSEHSFDEVKESLEKSGFVYRDMSKAGQW